MRETNRIRVEARIECRVVAIWIDWYAYHVARFEGLQQAFGYEGQACGIELVGDVGVHAGLRFREDRTAELPVETLLPRSSWRDAKKVGLAIVLWRRLSELSPEVVLVPGYYTLPAIAAAVWAKLHRRASVLMTESTAADHVRTGWKEWLKSRLVRALFDWAMVGGVAHRRYIRQLGFGEDRIVGFYDVVGNDTIYASTRALRRVSSRERCGLSQDYFLFVGRLAPEKNVAGLLQAWLEYRRGGGDWSLVLVGDGPEVHGLLKLIAGSPFAKDVVFAGLKNSQQLLPYFAFASCFVLPSTLEPWGLVVNEAMAASLPLIVSSRCGCAEDLVEHGRNGLLFNPARTAELTACMSTMAQLSRNERVAMGLLSAEKIAKYSPQNFGLQIAAIAKTHGKPSAECAGSPGADEPRQEVTA